MRESALDVYRCPACRGPLALTRRDGAGEEVTSGVLSCGCGASYAVDGGVPALVHPPSQEYLKENAETYEELLSFEARLLVDDERKVRTQAADLLEARPGDRVLEVACGPASNFPYVLPRIAPGGLLFALDISPEMISAARRRLAGDSRNVELLYANGSYLPFADAGFDALLHIGTLNRFPDVPRALSEMARVVKPGGKVVAGDEGLAPWLRKSAYGQLLSKFGGLFQGDVPLNDLPEEAEDVCVRWVFGRAYYLVDFRVGRPPSPNLDVELPGKNFTVREALEAGKASSS
jgi:SAM-dependent methyltransferase